MSGVRNPFITQPGVQLNIIQEFAVTAARSVIQAGNSETDLLLVQLSQTTEQEVADDLVCKIVGLNKHCLFFDKQYDALVEDYENTHDKVFGVGERPKHLTLDMHTGKITNHISGDIEQLSDW